MPSGDWQAKGVGFVGTEEGADLFAEGQEAWELSVQLFEVLCSSAGRAPSNDGLDAAGYAASQALLRDAGLGEDFLFFYEETVTLLLPKGPTPRVVRREEFLEMMRQLSQVFGHLEFTRLIRIGLDGAIIRP